MKSFRKLAGHILAFSRGTPTDVSMLEERGAGQRGPSVEVSRFTSSFLAVSIFKTGPAVEEPSIITILIT